MPRGSFHMIIKDVQNACCHIFIGKICAESDSISARITRRVISLVKVNFAYLHINAYFNDKCIFAY